MTCTRDCKSCVYGKPVAEIKCGSPNSTCNGECFRCVHKQDINVRYICTKRLQNKEIKV